MKKMKIFFICLTLFVFTKACPVGWVYGDDSYCYKTFEEQRNKDEAASMCNNLGGNLAMPTNAFANAFLAPISGTAKVLWLGVRCYGHAISSCYYEDGTQFTNRSYYNFLAGDRHQYVCTTLITYGTNAGKWRSTNCVEETGGYTCQIPYKVIPTCPPEYSQNGDSCYKVISMAQTYDDAEALCSASCGHVATPRSTAENDYITSLVSNYSYTSDYVRLGISYYNKQYYDANTNQPIAYRNFGYQNPNLGNCVGLSLINDVVARGKWINIRCNVNIPTICEIGTGMYLCNIGIPTGTPTPTHICTSPFYFENNGTVSSPYYPNTYNGETCTYILSVPKEEKVIIVFKELLLDENSQIELFGSNTDFTPFKILYSDSDIGSPFTSPSNTMKIMTKPSQGGNNRWSFTFSSYPTINPTASPRGSGCNAGMLYTSSNHIITSPNYPNNYPYNTTCYYNLSAPEGQRVSITFNDIRINDDDEIIIYDGTYTTKPVLKRIRGYNSSMANIESSQKSMLVIFSTDGKHSNSGFSARFMAI